MPLRGTAEIRVKTGHSPTCIANYGFKIKID